MFSKRSFTTSVLIAAIGLGAGAAMLTPSTASAGDKAVDCSKLKLDKVKAHCTSVKGDFGAVKKFMKDKTKDKYKCKDCHSDTKAYLDATDDTRKKLSDLLK